MKRGKPPRPRDVPTRRADAETNRRELSGRIASARRQAGFTQREVATLLKVSPGAVGQWETGGVPATERLGALADLLGVSLDWLLGKSRQSDAPAIRPDEQDSDRRLIDEARQLGGGFASGRRRSPPAALDRGKSWCAQRC